MRVCYLGLFMKRSWMAGIAIAVGIAAVLLSSRFADPSRKNRPLWTGAPFTEEERELAVERGIRFMDSMARDPAVFSDWGHDLLFAFQNMAETNANPQLSAIAWNMGHERAMEWRRQHPKVPPNAGIWTLSEMAFASDNADRLGAPDPEFDRDLRSQAARFSNEDFLSFDPSREGPPSDLPEPCHVCGRQNARGVQYCTRCKTKLAMHNRYALFMDALIWTSSGERFGASLGGKYSDVLRWLPSLRPYPAHDYKSWDYYDAVYAITHVVYSYNHYNLSRISPGCFPAEFEYLKTNLPAAIRDHDPELLGEYVDSLRAFGLDYSHAPLREATEYLLKAQNPDGSWGDPAEKDSYSRYHSTWTGLSAVQDFKWPSVLTCPGA
jgi:hypothetical protein